MEKYDGMAIPYLSSLALTNHFFWDCVGASRFTSHGQASDDANSYTDRKHS